MSIYAISDLHLSFGENKPMHIFGDNWLNHEIKIKENWEKTITEEDIVLMPGDFSWAMYLEDTYKDFEYLNNLPGRKIVLKGNHDYWWTTLKKMREYLQINNFNNIDILYNNSYDCGNCVICGARGWQSVDSLEDKKITKREIERLKLSIKHAKDTYGEEKEIIVMMHYPPFLDDIDGESFIRVMKENNIKKCIYGHLHSVKEESLQQGGIDGIEFKLVSCDYLDFMPIKI